MTTSIESSLREDTGLLLPKSLPYGCSTTQENISQRWLLLLLLLQLLLQELFLPLQLLPLHLLQQLLLALLLLLLLLLDQLLLQDLLLELLLLQLLLLDLLLELLLLHLLLLDLTLLFQDFPEKHALIVTVLDCYSDAYLSSWTICSNWTGMDWMTCCPSWPVSSRGTPHKVLPTPCCCTMSKPLIPEGIPPVILWPICC